ncbi:hypothetical protein [Anatilimnocola floriformis]|uniref:hypothetical protein n=1 Tax=Anatilimnocola floriformis TaxID=2948575 RepID=UPI0020C221FC|nr:hypothetical protein [Anatilimnocola floriformis]
MLPANLLAEHGFSGLDGLYAMVVMVVLFVILLIAGIAVFSLVGTWWLARMNAGGYDSKLTSSRLRRVALALAIFSQALGAFGVISLLSTKYEPGGIANLVLPIRDPEEKNIEVATNDAISTASGAAELFFAVVLLACAAFAFSRSLRDRIENHRR